MLDPNEQKLWFAQYLRAGVATSGRPASFVMGWARSMSLIADEMIDNDDSEPTEMEHAT